MKDAQEMGLGIHAYEWEPKWVNFLIWHGNENESIAKDLVHLMKGKRVVFRYYLSTGGHKDTSFTLKGSVSAITSAIGIN
jgi:phosphoribosylformylglycinamidine (FGAM) synthase-like amidotransferase family enzyme